MKSDSSRSVKRLGVEALLMLAWYPHWQFALTIHTKERIKLMSITMVREMLEICIAFVDIVGIVLRGHASTAIAGFAVARADSFSGAGAVAGKAGEAVVVRRKNYVGAGDIERRARFEVEVEGV
jgi:hypothetical protein